MAAVTITAGVRSAGGAFVITWTSSSSGPFDVYRDGVHVEQTYLTRVMTHAGRNESPVFEVVDDGETPAAGAVSQRFDLAWDSVAATKEYRVEQYISAAWTEVGVVPDRGEGSFRFRTDTLDDDANHQFRVTPVGTNGNDGTALTLAKFMVRHPDPPQFTHVVEADRKLTVTINT